jgi:hypothetical protein
MSASDRHIPFRDAILARDLDRVHASLATDVRFYSPLVPEPFVGREDVANILVIPTTIFAFHDAFRFTRTMVSPDGWYALAWEAQIEDKPLEGATHLRLDQDDLVVELHTLMRPLPQIQAFADAAYALLSRIGTETDEA